LQLMEKLCVILMIKEQIKKAIHMVSAWATENRLVLGQVKVNKNQMKLAIRATKSSQLSGCIVTIDAMGCQTEIVKLITEHNAGYMITLKRIKAHYRKCRAAI